MLSSMYFGTYNRTTPIRGPEVGTDDSSHYASVPFCIDLKGKTIPPGYHFVPGPDQCFVCICDRGSPKWCQAVLCAPPQDCKSFRVVGSSCCDFECLDKTLQDGGSIHNGQESAAELGSRLVAWTVSVVLSVSLIYFLFRRLRKKRHLSVLRRVFLNQDASSEANAAFSTPPPPLYLEAFGSGVDGQTFACLAPPGGVVTITTSLDETRLPSGSTGMRPVCGVVWKPDDLPPPYSEVVGAEEETVNVGGDPGETREMASASPFPRPIMSPPSVTVDAEDDEPDADDSRNDEEPGTSTRESEIGDHGGALSLSSVVEARNDSVLRVDRPGGQHRRGASPGEHGDTASLSSCASLPLSEDVVMRSHV